MKHIKILGLVGLAAAAASVHAQDSGILLTLKVEKDGQLLAKPRLVAKSGTQATIQKDQDLRIEVTPTNKDGLIDLAMKLYLPGPNGLAVAASPRMITKLDTPSTIEFQAPGEPRYKISLVASNHAIGAPLPAAQ